MTHPAVVVAYQCPNGFVTDFGEPLTMTSDDGALAEIPRYGVWKHDRSKGKPQVMLTTNDLGEAIAAAKEGL